MLPSSGDIVCVDVTLNLECSDAKMFNFICPSPVGGLKIAYVIVSTESEELQTAAFSALKMSGHQPFTFCVNGIH